jgi:glutathione peroxidase
MTPRCSPNLNFELRRIDGQAHNLCQYQGQTLLVVNVASRCGFTRQYEGLEALYQKYKDRGVRVLGFPANDFGGQEPGSNEEIKKFCSTRFQVSFDLFEKSSVIGSEINPLFARLTEKRSDNPFAGPVSWNFTKFLINNKGDLVGRYKSSVDPEEIAPDLEKIL